MLRAGGPRGLACARAHVQQRQLLHANSCSGRHQGGSLVAWAAQGPTRRAACTTTRRHCTILSAVYRQTGRPVFIKAFQKATTTSHRMDKMRQEQAVLQAAGTACCPGVVRLLETLDDSLAYYTVLEALPGA